MAKDIIFEDDIAIRNGDFKVAVSDDQHIEHILIFNTGQVYQSPTIGVGIRSNLRGSETAESTKQRISRNLKEDLFNITTLTVAKTEEGEVIDVNAKRNDS